MKAPPFRYHDPRGKDEVLSLLAGGQSLMPMLNFRLLAPQHVIDLNRVPQLAGSLRRLRYENQICQSRIR